MADSNHGFIETYTSGIPSFQRAAVESIIEERRQGGRIATGRHLREELERRAEAIRKRGMAFNFVPVSPGTTISSDFINSLFEDISIDLKSLYDQLALISSDRARLKAIQDDALIKTKSAILELVNQLRLFRFLKLNPEYQDAKYINFNSSSNRSTALPKAEVDGKTRGLKLPLDAGNRLAVGRFNFNRVKATVSHLGGGIRSDDKNFPIENSLDAISDTFWFSSILSDGIPKHKVRLSHSHQQRALASGVQNGNIYESNGIVFDIVYNFSKTISCNQIRLLPIAEYPVRVIDISYKVSDLSKDWITIPNFDPINYPELLDWIEWNGPRFSMVALRLLIEQANYTQGIYHIPKDLVYNNNLWSQIADSTYNRLVHTIELDQVLSDKITADPKQLTYLNELNDLGIEISDANLQGRNTSAYDIVERIKTIVAGHLIKPLPDTKLINTLDGKELASEEPLIEIRKYLFTCGIRTIEVNDNVYQPFAFYESQKFESNANILEVSIETNEQHRTIPDSVFGKPFYRTSVEWELQTADNTVFPIAPAQYLSELASTGNPETLRYTEINDEMMIVNRQDYTSITRFPIPWWNATGTTSIPAVQIRKNGNRLPQLVQNSRRYGGNNKYNYTLSRATVGNDVYIKTKFNDSTFDPRSIYTINYMADQKAAIVDLNSILDSQRLTEPESFSSVGRDNKVVLKYYPYVEYSIINDEVLWRQDSDGLAVWNFTPVTGNYSIGQASIDLNNLNLISGINTFWLSGVAPLVTGTAYGYTGAHFKFRGDTRAYKILQVNGHSGLTVQGPIETGFLPIGALPTGLQYVAGKTVEIDGTIYGLDNVTYEPISVYVNDVKAINKTDYNKLEHQAFLPEPENTRIYEYIQAGKNIYLNAPAAGKIEIDYRFLTQFIKINALLRCNKVVRATDTPIISDYTIRIKNSKI